LYVRNAEGTLIYLSVVVEKEEVIHLGVLYIGDRETGKTHLAMELANPKNNYVRVLTPDYDVLKAMLYTEEEGRTRTTDAGQAIYNNYIEIQVELPAGKKKIALDWLDTPGEIWRESWQKDDKNKQEWKTFLDTIKVTEGILLIVPPYRDMIIPLSAKPDDFISLKQWCHRFDLWVQFFRRECPKIRHLLICLNKADLFCQDLQGEARKLGYHPHRSPMTWQQRDQYVFQRYFRPVHSQIMELNRHIQGLSVRCFITSVKNRELLELPWIYLGSFLDKSTI